MTYYVCAHPRCRKPADIFIGTDRKGTDGWVCEKHLQYCSVSEDGAWRLHHYVADARKAQALEKWAAA